MRPSTASVTSASILITLASWSTSAWSSAFRIEAPTGAELVSFFETGDVHIAYGQILEGSLAQLQQEPAVPEFIIEDGSGVSVFRVSSDSGNLNVAGAIQQQVAPPLIPPQASFVIRNSNDEAVSYVDQQGNLVTTGRIFLHGRPVERVIGGGSWGGHSADVAYNDFSDISGITLDREAFQDGDKIAVTDTIGIVPFDQDVRIGAMWLDHRVPLDMGFRAEFTFTIQPGISTTSGGDPVDWGNSGLALVFQNHAAVPTLHPGTHPDCFGPTNNCGGEIGYTGLTNAVAIEFDSLMNINAGEAEDPHTISVQACNPLSVQHSCSIASALLEGPDFQRIDSPQVRIKGTHTAVVRYEADGTLTIDVDGQPALMLEDFDLPSQVADNEAWVGIVASGETEPTSQRVELTDFKFFVDRPIVIALSGEQFGGADARESGIYDWANCLDSDFYDVHFFDEDEVSQVGNGRVWDDYLKPRIELMDENARLAFIGHSHGGGSVYSLGLKLEDEYPQSPPNLQLIFTAYVDAIKNTNTVDLQCETRRPQRSLYHLNLYQLVDAVPQGCANENADAEWNVNSSTCVTEIGHGRIENCGVIHDLLSAQLGHSAFGTAPITLEQLCSGQGVLCDPTTGDHSCGP